MRRVLLLIESMGPGGAQVVVATLAVRLRAAGWHPVVCCWSRAGPLVASLAAEGVDVVELSLPRASIASPLRFGADLARIVITLRRVVLRERVDVIHAHLQDSNFLAAALAVLTRRPAILTVHNVQLAPLERRPGTLRYALRSWALRLAARAGYAVVAVGEQVGAALRPALGTGPRLRVIPNGIPVPPPPAAGAAAAVRARLGIPGGARLVVSVGRLVPQKRHADVIAALPAILRAEPAARLLLVGEGPEEDALRALASERGVADRVSFLGHRGDVPDLLAASDAFVLASAYEGIPLVVLEAMGHGLPVVVSDAPGNRELVTDEVTGLRVPVGAPERLADAVLRLLRAPDEARRMGERARAFVVERHDATGMVEQTARLYREAVEGAA